MGEEKNVNISGSHADSKAISEANIIISEGESCPFGHNSAKMEAKREFDIISQKYRYSKRCTLAASINRNLGFTSVMEQFKCPALPRIKLETKRKFFIFNTTITRLISPCKYFEGKWIDAEMY